jgi:hypothetical protein
LGRSSQLSLLHLSPPSRLSPLSRLSHPLRLRLSLLSHLLRLLRP